MWKTLKQVLPSKTMSNVDPEKISPDQFNDFFSKIGERLSSDLNAVSLPDFYHS